MLKRNYKESMQRYIAFWGDKTIDRPLVMFDTVGELSNPMYHGSGYNYIKYSENIKAFARDYVKMWDVRQDCMDDAMPCISPQMGGAFEAALFAGEINWGNEVASLSPHNPMEGLEFLDDILFDENNKYYKRLLKDASFLSANSKGRYGVNYDGNMSITTTISQLRGGTRFMLDLADDPEGVRRLAERITNVLIKLQCELNEFITRPNGGTCHRWLNYWNPGRGFWFSEDDAIMMSPEMYRDIFLDLNMKLCESTDNAVLHWHDGGLHLIKELLKIRNLRMVQVSPDPNGPPFDIVLSSCKEIVSSGRKVCFQTDYDEDKFRRIFSEIPYESCMFYILYAGSIEEANRNLVAIEKLAKASK